MIDIRIGRVLETAVDPTKVQEREDHGLTGRIVSARPGRGSAAAGVVTDQDRRRSGGRRDPVGSRILTVLITDAAALPTDRELKNKRVVLKIVD